MSPPDADLPHWDGLVEHAAGFGVTLAPEQVQQLRCYLELLVEWNERFNLTAIAHPHEILSKHFLDSLTVVRAVPVAQASACSAPAVESLLDVGSGAGFPGLVLKIAYPHLQVVLLDSLTKRVRFLERVLDELGLREVTMRHARAEVAGRDPGLRERFDVVTSRAVAHLPVLVEWMLPFARVGGVAVAMKGPAIGPEVEAAARGIELLGGGEPRVEEFLLPGANAGRSLVCIPKVRPTPMIYPRGTAAARRHPL